MVLYRSLVLASSVLIAAGGWANAAHAASTTTATAAADDDQDTPSPPPTKQNFVRTYDGKTVQTQSSRAVPVIINTDEETTTTTAIPTNATAKTPATPAPDLKKPIDPRALPYITRGSDLLKQAKFDLAINDLNKALEIDKNSIDARRYLALALLSKQLPVQALDQLNIVVKGSQPSSYDQQLVGQAYLAEYQNLEAITAYKESLKLSQENEYSRGGLATAYAYQGDFPGAFKIIQEGMQRSKNNVGWNRYYKALMEDISKLKSSPDPYKYLERNLITPSGTGGGSVIDIRSVPVEGQHPGGG